jgi:hypothetical protein
MDIIAGLFGKVALGLAFCVFIPHAAPFLLAFVWGVGASKNWILKRPESRTDGQLITAGALICATLVFGYALLVLGIKSLRGY